MNITSGLKVEDRGCNYVNCQCPFCSMIKVSWLNLKIFICIKERLKDFFRKCHSCLIRVNALELRSLYPNSKYVSRQNGKFCLVPLFPVLSRAQELNTYRSNRWHHKFTFQPFFEHSQLIYSWSLPAAQTELQTMTTM